MVNDKNFFMQSYSEFVQIDMGTTAKGTYVFPKNNENIEKGYVTAIKAYDVGTLALNPDNTTVVNTTYFKKSFLVLQVEGEERFTNIPLLDLNPAFNNGRYRTFNRLRIDFTKTKIIVPNYSAGFNASEQYAFEFVYELDIK